MTFTELEYVLMLAIAVLLWRTAVIKSDLRAVIDRADRYATFLVKVGRGEGTIVLNDEDVYEFKPKEKT